MELFHYPLHQTNGHIIILRALSHEKVIGFTNQEIGYRTFDFDADSFMSRLLAEGSVENQNLCFQDVFGNERHVIFSSTIMDFADEKCILSMSVDVTEARLLEEKLRQAQKMDAIGQLTGGIAHDFNNMLSGIIGGVELLTMQLPSDSPLRKSAISILKSAEMAADLTRKLLAFSRKGGQSGMVMVNLNEAISSSIAILERSIDRNISIETRLDASPSLVSGDPSLLQNVFLNLGINARDAMPDGGRLSFSTEIVYLDESFCRSNNYSITPGKYIQTSVSDTGKGIPKHIIPRIFEPFFTTKEPGKGTGLGLAAVYGTIKEHLGTINVYSEEGIGTVFRIYIPVSSAEVVTSKVEQGKIRKGNGLVLLVDDEEIVRNIAKDLLQNLGYDVIVTSNGDEALKEYSEKKENISLVLLDLVMPGINGRETFRLMKKINPCVKAVFTSGFAHEGSLINLGDPGVCGFIQKPYRISELGRVMASAMADACGVNLDSCL